MDTNKDSISENDPRAITIRVRAIDLGAFRRYFAGVEALARELRTTSNPSVIQVGLAVLESQRANVRMLLSGIPL